MTNIERLLEQSKDKHEIKDQMIAVMFEAIEDALILHENESNKLTCCKMEAYLSGALEKLNEVCK